MRVYVISNLYDRKNLNLVGSRVLRSEIIDSDKFYEPLAEAIYNNMISESDFLSK